MFVKGKSGNPNGRPRTGDSFVEQLREAILVVEKEKGKSLMHHAVERAYAEDTVLIALMKKLVPDMLNVDVPKETFNHFVDMMGKYNGKNCEGTETES